LEATRREATLADLLRTDALKKKLVEPPAPLFKEVRELILRKCEPTKEKHIRNDVRKRALRGLRTPRHSKIAGRSQASDKAGLLNLFKKKFTRERVVPIISASVSCEILGTARTGLSCFP
jgi:hypothetical protein